MRTANFLALMVCLAASAASAQTQASVPYLSPRCASLNEAIRTAPKRGLKYDTIHQMNTEYNRECSEQEREANARMYQERRDKSQQANQDRMNANLEKERANQHAQQCAESRRILHTKRARTDLNDGEKNELRRFEENFRARCN